MSKDLKNAIPKLCKGCCVNVSFYNYDSFGRPYYGLFVSDELVKKPKNRKDLLVNMQQLMDIRDGLL